MTAAARIPEAEVEEARFYAKLGSHELTQADPKGCAYLLVEDHVDMIGILKASVPKESFEWSSVKVGDDVEAGFGGTSEKGFKGVVTGWRHHRSGGAEMVTFIAMDPLCKLAASRNTKAWEEQSASDIASAVIGDAGCSAGTVDSAGGAIPYILQYQESNLQFLKRLAAQNGFLLMANAEGKIDFKKVQYSGSPLELAMPSLMSFDYTYTPLEVPTKIVVQAWNYLDKVMVSGEGASGQLDTIGGGEDAVAKSGVLFQQEMYISDLNMKEQSSAEGLARSRINALARTLVRGRARLKGTGRIHAGALVEFTGLPTGFNPQVFVVSSRHIVENGLYSTEFQFVGNTVPA